MLVGRRFAYSTRGSTSQKILTEDDESDENRRGVNGYGGQRPERRRDSRWVVAKRPLIITGGELTLADLELKFSSTSKFTLRRCR